MRERKKKRERKREKKKETDQSMDFTIYIKNINKIHNVDLFQDPDLNKPNVKNQARQIFTRQSWKFEHNI